MSAHLNIVDWGFVPFAEAWARQKALVESRAADTISDTLVFCEHGPTVTLGRASQRERADIILNPNLPVFEIERGGHATYHGPGQIVAYPVVRLGAGQAGASQRPGIMTLIRGLEHWVATTLRLDFSLDAFGDTERTGVWLKCQRDGRERKIASIGIAARHWVSYHGLALNLSTGAEPWTWINPCGFDSSVMTDVQTETGRLVSYAEMRDKLATRLDLLLAPRASGAKPVQYFAMPFKR